MEYKLGGIVRRNAKAIIIVAVLSVPVMALFQNCGKTQNIEITDIAASLKGAVAVNTNDLPIGDTQIDQIGGSVDSSAGSVVSVSASGDSSGSSEGGIVSIGQPSAEDQEEQEIEDSIAACAALTNSSNSNNINGAGVFSADHLSASNIYGKHVLSSADFNGNTQIASISNSHGSLTICGLDVETLSNYSGKVTLVNNSKIGLINSLNGRLVVIDGSGATVKNSKAVVKKIN